MTTDIGDNHTECHTTLTHFPIAKGCLLQVLSTVRSLLEEPYYRYLLRVNSVDAEDPSQRLSLLPWSRFEWCVTFDASAVYLLLYDSVRAFRHFYMYKE
jgi:hypothetical protein